MFCITKINKCCFLIKNTTSLVDILIIVSTYFLICINFIINVVKLYVVLSKSFQNNATIFFSNKMNSELALALIIKRWTEWQEVARYQLPSQQEAEKQNLLKLYTLYKKMKEKKNCAVQAELTPHIIDPSLHLLADIAAREEQIRKGDDALIVHMQPVDYENYFEYIRMDVETYNELFKLIEPKIKKQFLIKYPIPAHTRLQICLRYLASGDSMLMISSAFGVASNTVSKIVTETCQALWDILKDLVLPLPNKDIWKEKASAFEHQWDFPHCIGAIDKKQIVLQVTLIF